MGAGTLVLTGANTYTGGTLIESGTLQVGAGGTTGSIAGEPSRITVVLAFNRAGTMHVQYGGHHQRQHWAAVRQHRQRHDVPFTAVRRRVIPAARLDRSARCNWRWRGLGEHHRQRHQQRSARVQSRGLDHIRRDDQWNRSPETDRARHDRSHGQEHLHGRHLHRVRHVAGWRGRSGRKHHRQT